MFDNYVEVTGHRLLVPSRHPVSQVVGYIKGKSAIYIARCYLGRRRDFRGYNFWARGYFVTTVGRDEREIRRYTRYQETEERRLEQLKLV